MYPSVEITPKGWLNGALKWYVRMDGNVDRYNETRNLFKVQRNEISNIKIRVIKMQTTSTYLNVKTSIIIIQIQICIKTD